jgi:DNA-binding NtrC family response regulator
VHLPPLCERKDDIVRLADFFIDKFNRENGYSVEGIAPGGMDALTKHNWPGNIRELENAMERAVVLTRNGLIKPELFRFRNPSEQHSGEDSGLLPGTTITDMEKQLIIKTLDYCSQNRTKAADLLGISIRTLRNKLHEYGDEAE